MWQDKFKFVLLGLFFFHFAQYTVSPLYPIAFVRVLHLNDGHLGNGTAFYYLTFLIASTQLGRAVHRVGHKIITGVGALGMASYPIMLAFAHTVWHFYLLSLFNGFIFALFNGAYANYMLENIPPHDRPSHLAWYTIMFNFAILVGSLVGPVVADAIGLVPALLVLGLLRVAAGGFLLKWG